MRLATIQADLTELLTSPTKPYIRATSARSAVYDVTRIARLALADNPHVKGVALKWAARSANPTAWLADTVSRAVPWYVSPLTGAWAIATQKTRAGQPVLWEARDEWILGKIQDVYTEGANDLVNAAPDDPKVREWAGVLDSAVAAVQGSIDRIPDVSVATATDEAIDRGRTTVQLGTPLAVGLAALAFGAIIAIKLS